MADFKKQFGNESSHSGCSCNEKSGQKSSMTERNEGAQGDTKRAERSDEGRNKTHGEKSESSAYNKKS